MKKSRLEWRRKHAAALFKAGVCGRCGKRRKAKDRRSCVPCLKSQYKRLLAYLKKRRKDPAFRRLDCQRTMDRREGVRKECLAAYGGPKCVCCGEADVRFLTLDHINTNGSAEARAWGGKRRGLSYYQIRALGFPPGRQVMCYNCNCGRYRNKGVCPHKDR